MNKKLKKALIGICSIFGINVVIYLSLVFSPGMLYANATQVDFVTIHHNQALEEQTEQVVRDAIEILRQSDLYHADISIDLCLNDGSIYPKLVGNIVGGTAFALYNITTINHSSAKFNENIAEFQWEINNYELRKFNLTKLLAHEFSHNLQYDAHAGWVVKNAFGKINWKLEGHADYVARAYKNDGQLKEKIDFLLEENAREHIGIPVFKLEDGTIQNLGYYKYALVVQYLLEEEKMEFKELLDDPRSLNEQFNSMIEWRSEKE